MSNSAIIKERDFITSEARTLVLALCAASGFDEAREFLADREQSLPVNDVDRLLECRNLLCVVERGEGRLIEALRIHQDAYQLSERSNSHILRARFHNGLGITYEEIARREDSSAYFEKALSEYELARRHLEKAGDLESAGDLENNVAMVLCGLGRAGEAQEHLRNARAFFEGNAVKLAQVDDTEARIRLKEGKYLEAVELFGRAVQVFIRHGESELLDATLRMQMKASADYLALKN